MPGLPRRPSLTPVFTKPIAYPAPRNQGSRGPASRTLASPCASCHRRCCLSNASFGTVPIPSLAEMLVTQDRMQEPRNRWELLTQTGAGTPMGDLLRRYWWPIAGASEMDQPGDQAGAADGRGPRPLQGSRAARLGLLDRHCRHRRADLDLRLCRGNAGCAAIITAGSMTPTGAASSSPTRTWRIPRRAARTRSASRPTRSSERGGLLWAYLGPSRAPLVPNWEFFTWQNGFRQIVMAEIPCNWFQCQENSIDPVHFEWTHRIGACG